MTFFSVPRCFVAFNHHVSLSRSFAVVPCFSWPWNFWGQEFHKISLNLSLSDFSHDQCGLCIIQMPNILNIDLWTSSQALVTILMHLKAELFQEVFDSEAFGNCSKRAPRTNYFLGVFCLFFMEVKISRWHHKKFRIGMCNTSPRAVKPHCAP